MNFARNALFAAERDARVRAAAGVAEQGERLHRGSVARLAAAFAAEAENLAVSRAWVDAATAARSG